MRPGISKFASVQVKNEDECVHTSFALLHDDQTQHSDIRAHYASPDRLSLPLTRPASAIARVTVGQQQTDTVGQEDTLLHRETLLVVSSSNPENVSLELVRDVVTGDFLRDFFVHKITDAAVIIDVDEFLGAGGGVWGRYLMGYIRGIERVYSQEMLSFILSCSPLVFCVDDERNDEEQNGGKVFV